MAHTNNDAARSGGSTLGAAVVGAALGAAAVYLSSDKNRRSIQKKVADIQDKGEGLVDQVRQKADEMGDKTKKVMKDTEHRARAM